MKITTSLSIISLVLASFAVRANGILESFTITTRNLEIRESSETSIQFRADSNAYYIKLEPHRPGQVVFALSGIGYTTTARVSDLLFEVRVTGYDYGDEVLPIVNIDDINRNVQVEGTRLRFDRIYGSLPITFDRHVDSIKLEFINSMGLNINQYLGIQDLDIIPPMDIVPNPEFIPSDDQSVLIGIDASSSIVKSERARISSTLKDLVKKAYATPDSGDFCILEFSTGIEHLVESTETKQLVRTVKDYKKGKSFNSKSTRYTNWEAALDEALERKPDIFIFITDGWSNWSDGSPATFSSLFRELMFKCNTLKENGTRIVFITSDMNSKTAVRSNLAWMLNGRATRILDADEITQDVSLHDVDLVTMIEFDKMGDLNFGSIFSKYERELYADGISVNE